MQDFLKQAGWDGKATPITPDWSPRKYWRVERSEDERTAIFLQGPEQDFRGHGLKEFVEIGRHFANLGLSVPEIYVEDLPHARLLMEDFGTKPIDTHDIETLAYETAIDVLAVLRTDTMLAPTLTKYEDGYVFRKIALFPTDYAKQDASGWSQAWNQVLNSLPECPHVLSHIDYKAGNLHWLPGREGVKRIGILDYQAAQNAPFVYDCVTLLEDARRTLKPALKAQLKSRFRENLPADWRPVMDAWYPVIAAQFHTGVLGQISSKPQITPDLPKRLETYLREELQTPILKPLYDWCQKHGVLF